MNIFIKNKALYFNIVLTIGVIALLMTRQIPLSIILFTVMMTEGDIIIALKLKNNIRKAFIYMMLFMTIAISAFLTLMLTQLDNAAFRKIILFIL